MDYPEYENLAVAGLQAEFVRLADVFADASDRRQSLLGLIAQREATAKATAQVDSMSDDDKAALRAALFSRTSEDPQ